MKVLHVITGLERGGAEMLLAALLPALRGLGVEGGVVSLGTRGVLAAGLEADGFAVRALGMRPGGLPLGGMARLAGMLRRERPDLVQTWLSHADLAGGLAGRLAGVPVVWGLHRSAGNEGLLRPATRLVLGLNRFLAVRLPERIICCSASAYASHLAQGYPRARMRLAPNGVDTQRFRADPALRGELRARLGVAGDAPLVGHCARFDPAKGHEIFIRTAGLLARSHPRAVFVMCGLGVEASNRQLAGWIDAAGIGARVRLLGAQPGLEALLPGLDIFVSPSRDEALPLALLEALACELPCVVTDVGDQAAAVGASGVSLDFMPGTDLPARAAQACARLLDLPAAARLELGAQARRRVQQNYSLERTAAQYAEVYKELAGE